MSFNFHNLNILIISPEEWGQSFVSKHHYSRTLALLGNKVYFLNPPRKNLNAINIFSTEFDNLYVIDYTPVFRGLRFLPTIFSGFLESMQKNILEKACNLKFDVIWNFETSRFFNLDIWDKRVIKILHIVDLNQYFQTKKAASTADVCFCTSDFIQQKLSQFNKRVFKVHHGYNVPAQIKPIKLKGSIKAGYVGSLHIPYFDWEVTLKIVEQNPEVNFYFIGPLKTEKLDLYNLKIINKIKNKDNVHFVGLISALDLPNYLASMDVLLVLYKAEEFKEQLANPHKIMEYLGSGKVVVASYTHEYKDTRDLLLMADRNDQLIHSFSEAIGNLPYYNSLEKMKQRINFARCNSYEIQVEKIERLIFKS